MAERSKFMNLEQITANPTIYSVFKALLTFGKSRRLRHRETIPADGRKAHKTHDFKAFRSRFMNLEHFGLYIPERPHTFASDIFPVKD